MFVAHVVKRQSVSENLLPETSGMGELIVSTHTTKEIKLESVSSSPSPPRDKRKRSEREGKKQDPLRHLEEGEF